MIQSFSFRFLVLLFAFFLFFRKPELSNRDFSGEVRFQGNLSFTFFLGFCAGQQQA